MSNCQTLEESKGEFMQKCHELGMEYAKPWLDDCTDYGLLTLVAEGQQITELPEWILDEIWDPAFIDDFGGVPNCEAVLEGLNEGLSEYRDLIIYDYL